MKVISPVLKHVVYPGLAKMGRLRRNPGAGPVVVTYHGIVPEGYRAQETNSDCNLVRRDSLMRQLDLLKKRYNVISPEQFRLWCESKCQLPPRSVLLTCDDGLRNALTDILPAFQELGLNGLFFVTENSLSGNSSMLWHDELYLMLLEAPDRLILELNDLGIRERATGLKGKRAMWWRLVSRFSRFERAVRHGILEQVRIQMGIAANWKDRYFDDPICQRVCYSLNLEQTRRLAASGMCIGAHTLSHPVLSQMSADLAWEEIVESRHRLEQALERPIWALAYPFGHSGALGDREIEMAERAGYVCAFLNGGGGLGASSSMFAIPRVHVTHEMGLSEFEAHISGFHRTLRQYFLGKAAPAGFPS